jgi:hypothetical protein
MVDYYERRAVNPSPDFMQRAAEILDVSGIERIKRLPRKDEEFIIKFLDTVLEKAESV